MVEQVVKEALTSILLDRFFSFLWARIWQISEELLYWFSVNGLNVLQITQSSESQADEMYCLNLSILHF